MQGDDLVCGGRYQPWGELTVIPCGWDSLSLSLNVNQAIRSKKLNKVCKEMTKLEFQESGKTLYKLHYGINHKRYLYKPSSGTEILVECNDPLHPHLNSIEHK